MGIFSGFFGASVGPSLQEQLDNINNAQSALGNKYQPLSVNAMQSQLGYAAAHGQLNSITNTLNVRSAPWKTPMTLAILREHEVFKMPIEELVVLWIIKHGDDWVNETDIQDEFYGFARERLQSVGRLERHYVQDGPHGGEFTAIRIVKKEGA